MAYRNVGTPRFYVNVFEWLATNKIIPLNKMFRTLPVTPTKMRKVNLDSEGHTGVSEKLEDLDIESLFNSGVDNSSLLESGDIKNINAEFNYNGFSIEFREDENGAVIILLGHNAKSFTIIPAFETEGWDFDSAWKCYFTGHQTEGREISVGSIIFASYYTMPKSPDLSITLEWEYGRAYHKTTYLGNSISNSMWSRPPTWGGHAPWELTNPDDNINYTVPTSFYKSGRRIWKLKFSYIDDGDLFGPNQNISQVLVTNSGFDSGDVKTSDIVEDTFSHNILKDNNFFSQVWHKTIGGSIPFIFQPDGNNFNPDQFAICRIRDNSLQSDQVAPSVYNIAFDIEEVW